MNVPRKSTLIFSMLIGLVFSIVVFLVGGSYGTFNANSSQAIILFVGVTLTCILSSVIIFWLTPIILIKLFKNAAGVFMNLGSVNRLALKISLVSIFTGVICSLGLILGGAGNKEILVKLLLVSLVLFVASAAAMCTIKFFYFNKENSED